MSSGSSTIPRCPKKRLRENNEETTMDETNNDNNDRKVNKTASSSTSSLIANMKPRPTPSSNQNTTIESSSSTNDRFYFSDGESVEVASRSSFNSDMEKEMQNNRNGIDNDENNNDHEQDDDNDDDESDTMEVSLDAIKQKVLGRQIQTSHDVSDPDQHHGDSAVTSHNRLANEMTPVIQKTVSAALKQDLSCTICYEPFYQPLSLPCGHSFCTQCLHWWLDHSQQQQQQQNSSSSSFGNCPTCRTNLICEGTSFKVNTALRACVSSLFPKETRIREKQEQQALKKATKGENGGIHYGGYEILTTLQDESWIRIPTSSHARGNRNHNARLTCMVKRSIVLDEQDQRMQLALAISETGITIQNGVLHVGLCLLTMEEDEVTAENGFPFILKQEEGDDHFICTHEERFQCFVEAIAKRSPAKSTFGTSTSSTPSVTTEMPVARLTMVSGIVQFHIEEDFLTSQEEPNQANVLSFRHEETGAQLELKVYPPKGTGVAATTTEGHNSRTWVDGVRNRIDAIDSGRKFVNDEDHDDDAVDYVDEEGRSIDVNEFEDDGFVVNNEHVHEEEYIMSNDDDDDNDQDSTEDVCCLCQDGGELIACDGGDHLDGCGRYFHVSCINRNEVPPGDWICKECANTANFSSVGIEGYEFKEASLADSGNNNNNNNNKNDEMDKEDSSDETKKKRLKSMRGNVLDDEEDSDEEEFEYTNASKSKKVIMDDDNDSDDDIIDSESDEQMLKKTDGEESDGSLEILPQQKKEAKPKNALQWDDDDDDD